MNRSQTVVEGRGTLSELRSHIPDTAASGLFVVSTRNPDKIPGLQKMLDRLAETWPIVRFTDYETNARIEDIRRAVELFKSRSCASVLGIGGGTALDIAKAVALLATQAGPPDQYLKDQGQLERRTIGLLAVPTTAGTGSEATHFSVVYSGGQKYSLAHETMRPDTVILDSSLTDSLPPYQTACTGWDALSQSLESLWSRRATDESRSFSLRALDLCLGYLVDAVNGSTPEVRDQMLTGANLAGRAIDIARTTCAHALSYRLTSDYGLPHGHAVALTLPALLEYNLNQLGSDHELYRTLLERVKADSPEDGAIRLRRLLEETGLAGGLKDVGVGGDDLDGLARSALSSDRADNNPVILDHDALMAILRKSL